MRPRVFPAEDLPAHRCAARRAGASMRPRVFPAEDDADDRGGRQGVRGASMRPRVFPAEDECWRRLRYLLSLASMRPRVFPAEDAHVDLDDGDEVQGFNEAAGIPRGRPTPSHGLRINSFSFNEAAGIPRGRRSHRHSHLRSTYGAPMRPRVFPAEDTPPSHHRRPSVPLQ